MTQLLSEGMYRYIESKWGKITDTFVQTSGNVIVWTKSGAVLLIDGDKVALMGGLA